MILDTQIFENEINLVALKKHNKIYHLEIWFGLQHGLKNMIHNQASKKEYEHFCMGLLDGVSNILDTNELMWVKIYIKPTDKSIKNNNIKINYIGKFKNNDVKLQ